MEELKINGKYKYEVFNIKNRTIYSPNKELRKYQRLILLYLKILYPLKISIKETADIHTNQKHLLKMDIEHFYDTVPISKIEKVLKVFTEGSKKPLSPIGKIIAYFIRSYGKYNFKEIKSVTTVDNKLPTGALTSPYIANACMKEIDEEIIDYCKARNIKYSRYMDDLFFSSNKKDDLISAEKFVKNLLSKSDMKVNPEKTKYISDNKKQIIMGILVNKEKSCLPKETKRKIRSILHKYMTQQINDESYVLGYLSYVFDTDKEYFKTLNTYYSNYKNKYNTPKDKIKQIGRIFNRKLRKIK